MYGKFEHENYLRNNILGSKNTSKPKRNKKSSMSIFNDLKDGLISKYKGGSLENLKGYEEFENDYGVGVRFREVDKKRKFHLNTDSKSIYSNLKLVKGIGPKIEEKLKDKGYNTLYDLKEHKTYSENANLVLNDLESFNIKNTIDCIKKNSGDKLDILKCVGDIPLENFKFMDIETLGLSNTYIILLGVAELIDNKLVSSQYFLKDYSMEPAIISEYFKHIDEDSVLVSFNGKKFDVPFIDARSRRYRIKPHKDILHFDLMYYARSIWGSKLPNCKLQTIESEIFNYNRKDDVPGAFVPSFWKTYNETGNIGPVVPIIKHNRIDIVNLSCFLMKMCEEVNYD